MNQSENNFKITLRRRKLKSTTHFPLRPTQLYIRHPQAERSGVKPKAAHDVNGRVLTQQGYGLRPSRLLGPWDSPGRITGVGYHVLLQGIFPAQGSNLGLLHCSGFFTISATREAARLSQAVINL